MKEREECERDDADGSSGGGGSSEGMDEMLEVGGERLGWKWEREDESG